jgi:DNA-binding response OmpR family regulator
MACCIAMTPPHILIVDDDSELATMLAGLMREQGWQASTATTGRQGVRLLTRHRPSAVLLDVMLPDASGLDLCREWRRLDSEVGIVMLTARGDPIDRILGLELGADDYLPKPFEKRELLARLRALLRRRRPASASAAAEASSSSMQFGLLRVDLLRRELTVGHQPVPLTSIEFKLLLELMRRPGEAVSRDALSAAVQSGGYRPLARTVDVQVGRLRRRLAAAVQGHGCIDTVRGEGYALVLPPQGA